MKKLALIIASVVFAAIHLLGYWALKDSDVVKSEASLNRAYTFIGVLWIIVAMD